MTRPDRWWRPSTTRRPALRATRRARPTTGRTDFEAGYRAGLADDTTPAERDRYEQLRRAVDAGGDDLLDVADAAGATPLGVADPGQLVDELEAWLRGQD